MSVGNKLSIRRDVFRKQESVKTSYEHCHWDETNFSRAEIFAVNWRDGGDGELGNGGE